MKKDSLGKKFIKFSYGSWIGLVIGVMTTVIVTRIIPPEAFGKVSMFELVIQIVLILTIFGSDQSFVRFFYEETEEKRGKLLYNCLKIPLIITLLILTLYLIFKDKINFYILGESNNLITMIFVIGVIFQLLNRYSHLVIRMDQQANLYSILQILNKIFNLILICLFAYFIGNIYEIVLLSKVITVALVSIVGIYYGRKFWNINNIKLTGEKHSQIQILRYGVPFILTIFITWLFEAFDKIALRQWSDFTELGLYTAAMRIVALVIILKQTFTTFWTPVSYERFEINEDSEDFFRNISIIVSFAMYLIAIITIMLKDVIVILLGPEYKQASSIMPFLVFMPVLYTISETTVIGINFYKKVNWHIVIGLVSCLVNILGNWILVPPYGAIGASISTAFAFIVFFTLRTFISRIYYKVNYPLIRIYIMIILLIIYSAIAIVFDDFMTNIFIGFILVSLLFSIYSKDLYFIFKNRKTLL